MLRRGKQSLTKVSEAQRAVLDRGYCVLYLLPDRAKAGVRYDTWSALIDRGWIEHEQSNLGAKHPWERYRVTPAGRLALQPQDSDHA